jgi:hypothetical protein
MPLRSRGCSTNRPVTCGAPSGVGSVGLIDRTTICSIEKSEMIENLSPNAIGWLADVGLRQSRVADHGRPDVRYSRVDGRGACQAGVFRFPTLPPRDRGLSQRTEYQAHVQGSATADCCGRRQETKCLSEKRALQPEGHGRRRRTGLHLHPTVPWRSRGFSDQNSPSTDRSHQ